MSRLAPTAGLVTTVGRVLVGMLVTLSVSTAWGQTVLPKHYLHSADLPPGAIGRRQLQRGGPLAGYYQAVEVIAPAGSVLSLEEGGSFHEAKENVVNAGMQIGYVYRLKVGNIRFREGQEVYPTVEVIDRLYPPPGQQGRFPIPIELTTEELQMAADGKYVTRVIYLEDPQRALPVQDTPEKQRYFEVARGEDPLEIADRIGRPMAILRMGSRIPDPQTDDRLNPEEPPLFRYEKQKPVARSAGLEPEAYQNRWATPPARKPDPVVQRTSWSERLKNLKPSLPSIPTLKR